MFTMNPVLLGISLLGAVCFLAIISRAREFFSDLAFYLPMFLLITFTNPLFSHNGVTPLFFLNDQPVTFEAVCCGAAIAGMLTAVILWSKCFYKMTSSEQFLYLFGRLAPKLSLVLSMALRFVPLLKAQGKRIHRVQKTLGLYTSESRVDRIRGALRVFSALITWSLENALDTADSMKARGYGLKGRTSFSLFRFHSRDGILLVGIAAALCIVLAGVGRGAADFHYYPEISELRRDTCSVLSGLMFFVLAILPFGIESKENLQWTYLQSKI